MCPKRALFSLVLSDCSLAPCDKRLHACEEHLSTFQDPTPLNGREVYFPQRAQCLLGRRGLSALESSLQEKLPTSLRIDPYQSLSEKSRE